jgi:hypothetical protein
LPPRRRYTAASTTDNRQQESHEQPAPGYARIRCRNRRACVRCPRPTTRAAGHCDHEGGRHRQRVHLSQCRPSSDVRGDARGRDCDGSGRVWQADRRPGLPGRNPQGDRQARQVRHLQPSSLRSHCRRQGVQGRRRDVRRAPSRERAPRADQRSAHGAA